MRIVKPSYELLGTPTSVEEAWAFAAKAARNCYQSQKTNLDESEEAFCRRLLLKNPNLEACHLSPLEFGVLYLTFPHDSEFGRLPFWDSVFKEPYSMVRASPDKDVLITTNLRYLIEHDLYDSDLLLFAGPPTKFHVPACAFKMITALSVLGEVTRHRTLSFCVESTRYCNYSKGKFNKEVTFIEPVWGLDDFGKEGLLQAESYYLRALDRGWTPQQAAMFLPKETKTTIMMSGYAPFLDHMFNLRALEISGPVHPQMKEVMKPAYDAYEKFKDTFGSTK